MANWPVFFDPVEKLWGNQNSRHAGLHRFVKAKRVLHALVEKATDRLFFERRDWPAKGTRHEWDENLESALLWCLFGRWMQGMPFAERANTPLLSDEFGGIAVAFHQQRRKRDHVG